VEDIRDARGETAPDAAQTWTRRRSQRTLTLYEVAIR
jgi:hypothetical protein